MSRREDRLKQGLSDLIRRVSQGAASASESIGQFRVKLRPARPSVANRATGKSMGEHCEEMAKLWKIPRADQDRIALQSHQRAVKAMASGFFDDLVIPVDGVAKDGVPRADSSAEKLASLKPAFDRTSGQGTITAGNASALTDGAAAIWAANDAGLARLPAERPRARLVDWEIAAVDASTGIADGAGLRDTAPSRAPRAHARCHRPVGNPRGIRRAGALQRGGARKRGFPAREKVASTPGSANSRGIG